MRNYVILLTFMLLVGCSQYYRVATNFYCLQHGMSKQQVINWLSSQDTWSQNVKGGYPEHTKNFRHGSDLWEVWVFQVYRIDGDAWSGQYGRSSHKEYIAFINGQLEEWGKGELPLTIRQNPNQFQYDVNIQNR